MEKNKSIYIFLLLVCVALVFYTGFLISSRADMNQPMRSIFVKQGNEYIMKLDISNTEVENRNYSINVIVDGKKYLEYISLGSGKQFTYQHHIYLPLADKKVNVLIYKENEPEPISENIYTIGG
jgi:hypothetical protein